MSHEKRIVLLLLDLVSKSSNERQERREKSCLWGDQSFQSISSSFDNDRQGRCHAPFILPSHCHVQYISCTDVSRSRSIRTQFELRYETIDLSSSSCSSTCCSFFGQLLLQYSTFNTSSATIRIVSLEHRCLHAFLFFVSSRRWIINFILFFFFCIIDIIV